MHRLRYRPLTSPRCWRRQAHAAPRISRAPPRFRRGIQPRATAGGETPRYSRRGSQEAVLDTSQFQAAIPFPRLPLASRLAARYISVAKTYRSAARPRAVSFSTDARRYRASQRSLTASRLATSSTAVRRNGYQQHEHQRSPTTTRYFCDIAIR
jgi:hypothetical protein